MLVIIAAAAENNALGKDNDLVWHLPDDFKRFKQLTSGHHIIMGRKTFESFPKPLPNRTHVIITRQKNYEVPEGCMIVNNLEEAIAICPNEETNYIIGGGEIYKQSMDLADKIELTRVHTEVEADTFFPQIINSDWSIINEEYHPSDEKHKFAFTYFTYIRATKEEI